MENKHTNFLEQIQLEMEVDIKSAVKSKGKKSKFSNNLTIELHEDLQFNINEFAHAVEISYEWLVSNEGLHYSFDSIEIEKLAQITDYIMQ